MMIARLSRSATRGLLEHRQCGGRGALPVECREHRDAMSKDFGACAGVGEEIANRRRDLIVAGPCRHVPRRGTARFTRHRRVEQHWWNAGRKRLERREAESLVLGQKSKYRCSP